MSDCCDANAVELSGLRHRQARVLAVLLAVNALMFGVEFGAGLLAGSTGLLADSLDMLGDAFVYGFSLFVVHRSRAWRARAALAKGLVMAAFGLGVLVQAVLRLESGAPPLAPAMAAVATLALVTNAGCFALLWRHRADDINLRSAWLCSRNDLVANGAVLLAAAAVAVTSSIWPDFVVGVAIAALFLRTAAAVLRDAASELGRPDDAFEGAGPG